MMTKEEIQIERDAWENGIYGKWGSINYLHRQALRINERRKEIQAHRDLFWTKFSTHLLIDIAHKEALEMNKTREPNDAEQKSREARLKELEAMPLNMLTPSQVIDWMVEHNQCMGLYD